jgi:hypothetical protein
MPWFVLQCIVIVDGSFLQQGQVLLIVNVCLAHCHKQHPAGFLHLPECGNRTDCSGKTIKLLAIWECGSHDAFVYIILTSEVVDVFSNSASKLPISNSGCGKIGLDLL